MQDAVAPNASRLLKAGFVAILATAIGFSIRGGILDNWGAEFGFTRAQIDQRLGADVNLMFWMLGGVVTLEFTGDPLHDEVTRIPQDVSS